ncbi:MAG: PrsW family intramembrane metalloprotease [Thermoplasmata archaeon]|nr:PrsW family intramembrane metalloprotease [Thermoplasmata archaeon]
MSDLTGLEDLLLLMIAALVPALVYLSWVRGTERYQTQSWGGLLSLFFYGAIFATFIAGILEVFLIAAGSEVAQNYPAPEFTFLNPDSPTSLFFLILVVAPFVEEGLKASGVVRASDRLKLVSDGLVFGAAVGLGFGFFETFLYGLGAYSTGGLEAGLGLIVIRSLSSVLLHGSTTSMFGYGYAEMRLNGRTGYAGAYYLLAVAMHAGFNTLASLGVIVAMFGYSPEIADYASFIGLALALLYAFGAIEHARGVIQRTDTPGALGPPEKYRPKPVRVAQYAAPVRRR